MKRRHAVIAGIVVAAMGVLATTVTHAAFDSADAPQKSELQVLRVTPAGNDVPPGRQIAITFDRAMTPIGNMSVDDANAPVRIDPAPICHWHWLDPKSIACELDANSALIPATRYEVTINAGLRAEDGTTLKQTFKSVFTTERPKVTQYSFSNWQSPSTPVVRLVFNQPVSKTSVESSIVFSGQKHSLAEPDPYSSEVFYVLPLPGEKQSLFIPSGTPPSKSDDRATTLWDNGKQIEARRVWLVSPPQELGIDQHIKLQVSPGLRGHLGELTGAENRTIVELDTLPEFRFLGVRCRTTGAKPELLTTAIPPAKQNGCDPLSRVALVFSSPVIVDEIKNHLKLTPDLAGDRTDYDPWNNVWPNSWLRSPHKKGQDYEIQLPEHLKAFQNYSIANLGDIRDEFNRAPVGATAMQFRTEHRPPRLRLAHPVAVLEKNVPSAMPLYATNLTDIDIRYRTLTPQGANTGLTNKQDVTRVWDVSYAVPAKFRELLNGNSGVVSGALIPHPTPLTIDEGSYFDDNEELADQHTAQGRGEREFFAEITPYQVHAKLGHYNTLVWVTALADGKPIADASVRIYQDAYTELTNTPAVLGEAKTDKQGIAMLPGRIAIDPSLSISGYSNNSNRLMIRVDAGNDMALLPLDYNFEIDTYRASRGSFFPRAEKRDGHITAWGTTAQGVYKLGDTVQFKLYVRNQNNLSLEPIAAREGFKLDILDPTGKSVQEIANVTLSEFGAYNGEFRVPTNGAVGWYQFRLSRGTKPSSTSVTHASLPSREEFGVWLPMQVLVADFTPAPFQVQTTLNGELFEPGDQVEASTRATLHAGGPYANADTRITARLWPQEIEVKTSVAEGFAFDSVPPSGYCDRRQQPNNRTIHETVEQINERGELTTTFIVPDADIIYGRMEIESAVRDERGKYVASRAPAQYRARDRYVGLHASDWTFQEGKPATVQFIVVDKNGKVVPGVPVTTTIRGEVVTAARVKGAGNAYLTSYDKTWEERGACSGQSADAGQGCTFTPGTPGLYSIQASVTDTHGNQHSTELCTWVTGKGRVVWQEPEDMSLTLIPEKSAYKVGDKARYLVKNPFPGARALITIERFGVIKSWVETLKGNTPVIEFPIESDYLPGFYLSVVVMSPRVAPVPGASPFDGESVDLGRPTYRIGYLQIPVVDPYKSLDVKVSSDRNQYKPREQVKLSLQAKPKKAADKNEPVEFAVAVLDEAVFDLIQDGKNYFDPYRGFYQLENLDLTNYGLLSRLVGLQKFEKKGANAGGDGGAGLDMRSVSKYVAYWNPSVPADKEGRASLQFQLPDNLTGWRVFAIAVTPSDRLGLGDYKFKSSKLTELRPIMPNQLTEGDQFIAGFSVLNRSDKPRTITVDIGATGPIEGGQQATQKTLELGPFKRESVWLPLRSQAPGSIALTAKATDAIDKDALRHDIAVHKRVSLDVAASYGTTEKDRIVETIQYPKDMLANTGALSVVMSPSVIGNIDGAFRYIRSYPYDCWEQRLTRALMAANYLRLRNYLSPDLQWPEAASVAQAALDDAANFQAPNGGMGFWAGTDARVSPYLSAATALAFNELRKAGYRIPEDVDTKLTGYLQKLLRDNTAPSFYSEGMLSSVRAVTLKVLAERKQLSKVDLERYRSYAPRMDLFGLSAYLQAAIAVKGGEEIATDLAQRILSHSNESGGKFQFTETWDDGYHQLLATPLRSQCAVLQALLAYGETGNGATLVGDIPFKLVRSITQARGKRDHWENTQENLYCATALANYSGIYEKQAPQFSATVKLDNDTLGQAKFSDLRDAPVSVEKANAADAGRKAEVSIAREGQGRLYYSTRLSYSLVDHAATETNKGIEIHREYCVQRDGRWQLLQSPVKIKRGELVRVDIYLSLPAARNFVVVDDPVPGGVEPINRDLATASTVDADKAEFEAAGGSLWFKFSDWSEYGVSLWSFYHRELKHDSARFYADYLPAGNYHLSYATQAIAEGEFNAAPVKAEEMYDPDVYGKGLPARVIVEHD